MPEKVILLLEDEEVLGRLYAKKMQYSGFETIWVKTIDELRIELLARSHIDIVILDHGIQGQKITGVDIIPEVKKYFPQVKVIMLSNYSSFTLEDIAREKGAYSYLVKLNTSPESLISYIRKIEK